MKKYILLLAISILITLNCFSQMPNYLWAKRAGNNGSQAYGIAADASGNVFVTGTFIGPNIVFGATTLTNAGGGNSSDIFIVKYDPNGNVLWAKKQTAGGTAYDVAKGVAVDANGNVIITGNFDSPSITFGTSTLTNAGANDIFTVKYDPNGNVLWAKKQGAGGSANNDVPYRIAADASGNIIITGNFQSPTITFGTTTLTNLNGTNYTDIFIVKYDPNGNVLWAKQQDANGNANELGAGVAADTSGNVIVSGWFNSPTVTFGTTTLTNAQGPSTIDIFIVKYDPNGNVLWAKQQDAGGTGDDNAVNVTADAAGNVIITGNFTSPTLTFGATTLTNAGVRNIFIVKYDPNGNVLWAKQQDAGGTGDDAGNSVVADANGNALIGGNFKSGSITFGTTTLTNAGSGSSDLLIVKYDPNGNVLWAKQQDAGGTGADVAYSITVDTSGNVIATGTYTAQANPPINITFGTTTLGIPPGNPVPTPVNIFVAKLEGTAAGIVQPPAFNCSDTAYLFQGNPTSMYGVDLLTGTATLLDSPLINIPYKQFLSAFGYNKVDNYIWGYRLYTNQLVRVASDYSVDTFSIAGLPNNKNLNGGCISDLGILFLYLTNDTVLYRIDLNSSVNPQLILPNLTITSSNISDWAFSPIDGNIYSIDNSTWHIYRFDTTGVRTDLGIANGGGIQGVVGFGAIFMDSSGSMYASNNATGQIFKIAQPNNGNTTAIFFSQGPLNSLGNDGASCAGAFFNSAPIISLQSSDTIFCEKQCIDFTDLSTNNPTSWQWYFNGANPDTSTVQNPTNICYNTYGSFDVTLIACNAAGCDTLTLPGFINEYQTPIPVITQSNDTLFASQGVSYQWWSVGSGIVFGATNSFFVPSLAGNYFVIVTDTNGCEGTSNVIAITGVKENGLNSSIKIYPNPSNGKFYIELSNFPTEKTTLTLSNVIGQKLQELKLINKTTEVNFDAEDGIYFLTITTDTKGSYTEKFVLQREK